MKNIPIALRTRNRPVYLDITLRSLCATKLPEDPRITILDDCSDDPITITYLTTDSKIELPTPQNWPDGDGWKARVGNLPVISSIEGIASKVDVIQPPSKKGVRGGIFWCIDTMMERYPESPEIIIIEADTVFNEDWYLATLRAFESCYDQKGPNGDYLGLLTAYDRKPRSLPRGDHPGWTWRSVKRLSNGNWGCGNGIGGVMYLVTRPFYEAAIDSMKKRYQPGLRAGDTALQACCARHQFSIAATVPSFIQHIGVESLAWPEKSWRHARNFKTPFVLASEVPQLK